MNKNIKTWPKHSEINELRAQVAEFKAARIAYASEFPFNSEGDPDTGSIHANIRAMKKRIAELEARTPAAPDDRQHMSVEAMQALCAANPNLASGTPAAPVVAEELKLTGETLAWALVLPNGNIRLWSKNQATVEKMMNMAPEATLTPILAAHPVAGSPAEAEKATLGDVWASGGVHWDLFPGFLIDTREGDILTEEGLQFALAAMLKDADYLRVVAERTAAEPMPASEAARVEIAMYQNRLVGPNGHKGRWVECEWDMHDRFAANPDAGDGFKYEVRALCAYRPNLAAPAAPTDAKADQTQRQAVFAAFSECLTAKSMLPQEIADKLIAAANPAAPSVRDAARYQLLRSIGGKSWTRTGTTDRVVGAEYDALVDAERALIQSPQPGKEA